MTSVLLLGRRSDVVDQAKRQLDFPDVRLSGGTGIEDVRTAQEITAVGAG